MDQNSSYFAPASTHIACMPNLQYKSAMPKFAPLLSLLPSQLLISEGKIFHALIISIAVSGERGILSINGSENFEEDSHGIVQNCQIMKDLLTSNPVAWGACCLYFSSIHARSVLGDVLYNDVEWLKIEVQRCSSEADCLTTDLFCWRFKPRDLCTNSCMRSWHGAQESVEFAIKKPANFSIHPSIAGTSCFDCWQVLPRLLVV